MKHILIEDFPITFDFEIEPLPPHEVDPDLRTDILRSHLAKDFAHKLENHFLSSLSKNLGTTSHSFASLE